MAMNSSPVEAGDTMDHTTMNQFRQDVLTQVGEYVVSTGSANAYVLAIDDNDDGDSCSKITAINEGHKFYFKANFTNTGACTLTIKNVGGTTILAATAMKDASGAALAADAIVSGNLIQAWFDGTNFRILNITLYKASQAEAEAGTNDDKYMTPLKTEQNFEANWVSKNDTIYGDGSDGDVTISTPTTLVRDMYYNNLTVNSTLITDGFRIYVKGTINGSGTVTHGTPNNGASVTGYDGTGAGGAAKGAGFFKGTAGANGEYNSGSSIVELHGAGGVGGSGGTSKERSGYGSNNPGGTSSVTSTLLITLINISAILGYDVTASVWSAFTGGSGGGGGGGFVNSASEGQRGAGGGQGGGVVWIAARVWAGTFTIEAKGGNGGNVTYQSTTMCAGGGGGGGGGCILVIYGIKTWTGSHNVSGGVGGTSLTVSGVHTAGYNGEAGKVYEIHPADIL